MFEYSATVLKWADGDSVSLAVDLGFHIQAKMKFRLAGIDTPEINSPDDALRARAMKAKARVNELCPVGSSVIIRTERDRAEKWGRFLAWVQPIPGTTGTTVNDILVSEGLARIYDGGVR